MKKPVFHRQGVAHSGGEGMHGPQRLLFLLATVALSMALGAGVWALPTQNQLRATVPTRTPTIPPPTEVAPTQVPPTEVPPTQAPPTAEPTKEKKDKKELTQAPAATEVPTSEALPTTAAVAQVAATATTDPVTTVQQFPKTGMDVGPIVLGSVCGFSVLGAVVWLAVRRRASGSR
jgi:hypothetical protein